MLAVKLDAKTLAAVRRRADFFFEEQCKRLGPLPGATIEPAGEQPPPKRKRAAKSRRAG